MSLHHQSSTVDSRVTQESHWQADGRHSTKRVRWNRVTDQQPQRCYGISEPNDGTDDIRNL